MQTQQLTNDTWNALRSAFSGYSGISEAIEKKDPRVQEAVVTLTSCTATNSPDAITHFTTLVNQLNAASLCAQSNPDMDDDTPSGHLCQYSECAVLDPDEDTPISAPSATQKPSTRECTKNFVDSILLNRTLS